MPPSNPLNPNKIQPQPQQEGQDIHESQKSLRQGETQGDLGQKKSADQFRDSKKDPTSQAQQLAKTPVKLGKKIAPQRSMNQPLPTPKPQADLVPKSQKIPVTSQDYRALTQDQLFTQTQLRNSQLHQQLQLRGGDTRQPPMSNRDLNHLWQTRNRYQNPQLARRVIQHQVILRRQQQQQNRFQNQKQSAEARAEREVDPFLRNASSIVKQLEDSEGESKFETTLKKLLKGMQTVPSTPEGKSAKFKLKTVSDWRQFFQNVLSRGSGEKTQSQPTSQLAKALYRGSYAGDEGSTLVSDLEFLADGKVQNNKFSRILVKNNALYQSLKGLEPGSVLDKEFFKKLGSELEFTKLVHQTEILSGQEAEEARKANLKHLKSQVNPEAIEQFQRSLMDERDRWEQETGQKKKAGTFSNSDDPTNPFYQGPWQQEKPKRGPGKTKLWLMLMYAVGASLIGLGLLVLFRSLV